MSASKLHTEKRPFWTYGAIFLVWLVHISGLIGISMGHEDFFIPKTPASLGLVFLVTLSAVDWKKIRLKYMTVIAFGTGMLVEYLGTNHGLLFGTYTYGANLGPKILGVPWMIGVNWAMLLLLTGVIAERIAKHWIWRVIIGAGGMVLLDLFIEPLAPVFDYWLFEGGIAPLQNYVAWFIIAGLLHYLFCHWKLKGDVFIALHLFAAQMVFFIGLNVI